MAQEDCERTRMPRHVTGGLLLWGLEPRRPVLVGGIGVLRRRIGGEQNRRGPRSATPQGKKVERIGVLVAVRSGRTVWRCWLGRSLPLGEAEEAIFSERAGRVMKS